MKKVSEMNEQRLQEFGEKLKAMLKEYDIDEEGFELKVFVSLDYYDSIKDNFSKRNPLLDLVVGIRKDDWGIDVMYLPRIPPKQN
jgi:hypothetical protein